MATHLIQDIETGQFYVGASAGWHRNPVWAFECDTATDADTLGALTGRPTRAVPTADLVG